MFKKTVKYVDYDNVEREEDFYFNLTTAELAEMEMSVEGGLVKKIEGLVKAKDGAEIIKLFKEIMEKAYGIKSPDGRRFIKSKEIFESFSQTEAFSIIFMEFATDAEKGAAFVRGIVPQLPNEPPKG